jgi:hypothetical protein
LTTGVVTFCLGAAVASATTFYASPQGDGSFPCERADPCPLLYAADQASDGDEVIALPGVHDLGADYVDLNFDTNVHGLPGRRTVVRSTGSVAIWAVQGDARVADLRIRAPAGQPLLAGFGHPTFERVQAIGASSGQACSAPIAPGRIRNSLCVNTGTGPALGFSAFAGSVISWSFEIVNVTAIAVGTGSGANGIDFEASGNLTMSAAASNTVAQGAGSTADVHAANSGTGSVSVALDHSNFNLIDAGAGTSITPAGSADNQTSQPAFVDPGDLDFHQRRGSPTVNAGTTAANLGPLDFDRQPRRQGAAPDIGADEFDNRLKLGVKARKHQRASGLKARVSCPDEECTVFAKGWARADGERFALTRTDERFLEAGEQTRLKLEAEHLGRLSRALEDGNGKATIKLKGTDAGGVVATKRKRVELVG